jgi:hypothetical protein
MMAEPTRVALFWLGLLLLVLAVLFELGASALLRVPSQAPPGLGIGALAVLDLLLLYTGALLALDALAPLRAIVARLQGVVTFLLSLLGLLACIVLIMAVFALLILMVSLLVSAPFGTIAYFAAFGDFPTVRARVLLGLVMALKLCGLATMVVARPGLVGNKGFMLLLGCSIGLGFVLSLLHAIPPGFLVSITDAIGALLAAIVAAVWLVVFLIGALPGVIRGLRGLVPRTRE